MESSPPFRKSQASGSLNDLPVKGYDYQAPIGEFGQMHPVFSDLKILHLFLHDFGADAGAYDRAVSRPHARRKIGHRHAARDGAHRWPDRGFLFINNYQPNYPLPDRKNFQVELQLPSGSDRRVRAVRPRSPAARIPSGP